MVVINHQKGEIESASRTPCGFWCLNDKMIKELISFAKCEIGKISCECIEAIHLTTHMLWPIGWYILNVIKQEEFHQVRKKRMD
jgi:hypothetical protein